jgi:hypothetical protein
MRSSRRRPALDSKVVSGSSERPDAEAPLPRVPVVLLCAEDDDLDLVSFVHTARQRGLEPEVVTGVDENDRPLLEALAQNGAALFVALRSENLDQGRTLELKRLFARHAKNQQKLLALRLEPERAKHLVQTIARRLRSMAVAPPPGPRGSKSTAPRLKANAEAVDARWDDKTVIAEHLPRPPGDFVDENAEEAGERWDDETVVAEHLPRPPQELPEDLMGDDDASTEEFATAAVLPNIALQAATAEAPAQDDRRRNNIGLWFALALLVVALWKNGPTIVATCVPSSTDNPKAPTEQVDEPSHPKE